MDLFHALSGLGPTGDVRLIGNHYQGKPAARNRQSDSTTPGRKCELIQMRGRMRDPILHDDAVEHTVAVQENGRL